MPLVRVRAALTAMAAVALAAVVSATGCKSTGVGDPCIPEQEYAPDFIGFDYHEVNVESKSFQCQTRLCLVNHFQGRVSCPYGQNAQANGAFAQVGGNYSCDGKNGGPSKTTQCCTPGVSQPVVSDQDCPGALNGNPCLTPPAMTAKSIVNPNCTDRTADKAVYCSCRCANPAGKTDDGANYCQCPDGFECDQLIEGVGIGDPGLVGAYCIKAKTKYNTGGESCPLCDPNATSGSPGYCGPVNTAQ